MLAGLAGLGGDDVVVGGGREGEESRRRPARPDRRINRQSASGSHGTSLRPAIEARKTVDHHKPITAESSSLRLGRLFSSMGTVPHVRAPLQGCTPREICAESARGITPRAAHRTVRETLTSHGSCPRRPRGILRLLPPPRRFSEPVMPLAPGPVTVGGSIGVARAGVGAKSSRLALAP